MEHCCMKMEGVLEEYNSPLSYIPYFRGYYLDYPAVTKRKKNAVYTSETIIYYPWCGKKQPKDLLDEWINIVKQEFGVKETLDQEELDEKVPKEYMTDEWWKKQGL